jgi:hypothetical protein
MVGMTALESARHRSRAPWGDARFFLGIVLVVASVAGVWFVVSASRQTVPVFTATRTIVPGEAVSEADLRLVDVALGQVEGEYLTSATLDDGLVATRTVEAGELVPESAVGAAAAAATTTVVLRSAVDVPASIGAGSIVEVWDAPLLEKGGYDVPRILVADATVVSVTRDDSMIGGGAAALEVVIPRADVAAVLAAMADESAISVVPTAGSGR